jgi:sulfopyruvate decarboxylase TPP-binding subunit
VHQIGYLPELYKDATNIEILKNVGVMWPSFLRCNEIPNVLRVFNRSENNDITVSEEDHVLPIVLHLCGNDKPYM